ncbi:hypothetical protein F6Y02_41575 (plasmid) [Bacillus megaterium]|nr:hypothetical protein [Priestia megaterium]NGY80547.1 hypothetical protein [Priestia megaterium]
MQDIPLNNVDLEIMWNTASFELFPSIIAHEYWRLHTLFKEKQFYGAMLQLKDVFEVIIKFPCLILIGEIYQKKNELLKKIESLLSF